MSWDFGRETVFSTVFESGMSGMIGNPGAIGKVAAGRKRPAFIYVYKE
jgi:hypothetical protein